MYLIVITEIETGYEFNRYHGVSEPGSDFVEWCATFGLAVTVTEEA